jgi:hypothetical protein
MGNHADFRASVVAFCNTSIEQMKALEILRPDATYFDFEAMSDIASMPKRDMVGVMNLHWTNDGSFYDVGFSLGIATWEDTGLFRHHDVIDFMEPLLRTNQQIPLLNAKTGARDGWLVMTNGQSLMPMMKTETRPLQFMLVGALASRTT